LLPIDNNTEFPFEDLPTFQEDVLEGIFGVDIGIELDNLDPTGVDEITNQKELEVLAKKLKNPSLNEEEELDEEEEEVQDEEEVEEVEDEESEDEEEEVEEHDEGIRGRSGRTKRMKKNSDYVYF
jgi:type IV secretory pathway VirB10-like protein